MDSFSGICSTVMKCSPFKFARCAIDTSVAIQKRETYKLSVQKGGEWFKVRNWHHGFLQPNAKILIEDKPEQSANDVIRALLSATSSFAATAKVERCSSSWRSRKHGSDHVQNSGSTECLGCSTENLAHKLSAFFS